MGLLDWLFPEEETVKNEQIAKTEFKMLTGYRPVFKTHQGSISKSAPHFEIKSRVSGACTASA